MNTERERKGQNKMAITTAKYGTMMIRKGAGCGDTLLETVSINGKLYEIYLGYLGYPTFYAVEKIF
jgi:hypothetical protein